jgi:predicted nucleic acid-binding protein
VSAGTVTSGSSVAVVDASVVIKWVVREPGNDRARRLLERAIRQELRLAAPYILVSETGSALLKRSRQGHLNAAQARTAFQFLLLYSPDLFDSPSVSQAALDLAGAHHQSFYDCLYLAWALELRCDFITADRRFVQALGSAFRCVRLL